MKTTAHNTDLGIASITDEENPRTGLTTVVFKMTKQGFDEAEIRREAHRKRRAKDVTWAKGWTKALSGGHLSFP